MPSRGRVRGPVASMCCGWPDDHWEERPTVCRYALDRSHRRPLNTRASVVSRFVLTRTLTEPSMHNMIPVSSIL